MHIEVIGGLLERLGEGLSDEERHSAPVDPRVIGRTCLFALACIHTYIYV